MRTGLSCAMGIKHCVKFVTVVTEVQHTLKLTWKTENPVWVDQWPLTLEKLQHLRSLVDEQLKAKHIVPMTSPRNLPVFVIEKRVESGDC